MCFLRSTTKYTFRIITFRMCSNGLASRHSVFINELETALIPNFSCKLSSF